MLHTHIYGYMYTKPKKYLLTKLGASVNNKGTIPMYLGYNLFDMYSSYRLPVQPPTYIYELLKQWLSVVITYLAMYQRLLYTINRWLSLYNH